MKELKKFLINLTVILIFCILISISVHADVGPKPTLEILVENAPESSYYLDLLVDYTSDHLYQYIEPDELEFKEIFDTLKNYNIVGWRPALVTGTKVPLHGKLTGKKEGRYMRHSFSYVGVPDRFKIIMVTENNEIIVSENVLERKAFNTVAYFDSDTKVIREKYYILPVIKQFISTSLATLIIEGLILLLFRFNLKKNWKPFLIINMITQLLLSIIINISMYYMGIMLAILAYAAFEWVILISESVFFAKYLDGHTRKRRVFYGITANLVSFAAGVAITIYITL